MWLSFHKRDVTSEFYSPLQHFTNLIQSKLQYAIHDVIVFCVCYLVEVCPFGEQSNLPGDEPVFIIESDDVDNPERAIRGSNTVLPVVRADKIFITVADEPDEFFVMDIMYDATVPTKVRYIISDESIITRNVSDA